MAYSVKGAPFRYKGAINVEDCKTSQDVMRKAHLDWEVEKCELFAKMPSHGEAFDDDDSFFHGNSQYRECSNAYATYRTDCNIPLGIVKERYTPVQNIDAFTFFDDAIGKDKAIWQTAGFFGDGERIFVSAKLPKTVLVHGDPVENYLVFTTSHDGSSGVKILFTPIRVVCQNTLNAAIRNASNFVSFKHTQSVHSNLNRAVELLGICNTYVETFAERLERMVQISISDDKAEKLFADVILNDNEQARLKQTGHNVKELILRDWRAIDDTQISMKKVNVLSEMNNYYYSGVGQKEIIGTAYGAYNAITGYYSNVDNSEGTKRMDSLLYGDKSRKLELAGNLALAI